MIRLLLAVSVFTLAGMGMAQAESKQYVCAVNWVESVDGELSDRTVTQVINTENSTASFKLVSDVDTKIELIDLAGEELVIRLEVGSATIMTTTSIEGGKLQVRGIALPNEKNHIKAIVVECAGTVRP